jgi:hypothetical protein
MHGDEMGSRLGRESTLRSAEIAPEQAYRARKYAWECRNRARSQFHQGVDWVYGGWDRDVMEGNLADNGPNPAVGDIVGESRVGARLQP